MRQFTDIAQKILHSLLLVEAVLADVRPRWTSPLNTTAPPSEPTDSPTSPSDDFQSFTYAPTTTYSPPSSNFSLRSNFSSLSVQPNATTCGCAYETITVFQPMPTGSWNSSGPMDPNDPNDPRQPRRPPDVCAGSTLDVDVATMATWMGYEMTMVVALITQPVSGSWSIIYNPTPFDLDFNIRHPNTGAFTTISQTRPPGPTASVGEMSPEDISFALSIDPPDTTSGPAMITDAPVIAVRDAQGVSIDDPGFAIDDPGFPVGNQGISIDDSGFSVGDPAVSADIPVMTDAPIVDPNTVDNPATWTSNPPKLPATEVVSVHNFFPWPPEADSGVGDGPSLLYNDPPMTAFYRNEYFDVGASTNLVWFTAYNIKHKTSSIDAAGVSTCITSTEAHTMSMPVSFEYVGGTLDGQSSVVQYLPTTIASHLPYIDAEFGHYTAVPTLLAVVTSMLDSAGDIFEPIVEEGGMQLENPTPTGAPDAPANNPATPTDTSDGSAGAANWLPNPGDPPLFANVLPTPAPTASIGPVAVGPAAPVTTVINGNIIVSPPDNAGFLDLGSGANEVGAAGPRAGGPEQPAPAAPYAPAVPGQIQPAPGPAQPAPGVPNIGGIGAIPGSLPAATRPGSGTGDVQIGSGGVLVDGNIGDRIIAGIGVMPGSEYVSGASGCGGMVVGGGAGGLLGGSVAGAADTYVIGPDGSLVHATGSVVGGTGGGTNGVGSIPGNSVVEGNPLANLFPGFEVPEVDGVDTRYIGLSSGAVLPGAGVANGQSPSPINIAGQTLTPVSSAVYYIAGQRLSPGGPAITIDGKTITVPASGGGITVDGAFFPIPTPTSTQTLTIDGEEVTVEPVAAYTINGQVLQSGGKIIDLGTGTSLSLGPSALAVVANGRTSLIGGSSATRGPLLLSLGATTYTANAASQFGLASTAVLSPGGKATWSGGAKASLHPSATAALINGVQVPVNPTVTPPPRMTLAGTIYEPNAGQSYLVGGALLTPGGAAELPGFRMSLSPDGRECVVNGVPVPLSAGNNVDLRVPGVKTVVAPPHLTIGRQVYLPDARGAYDIERQTLRPGGKITVGATTAAAAAERTTVVLATNAAAVMTLYGNATSVSAVARGVRFATPLPPAIRVGDADVEALPGDLPRWRLGERVLHPGQVVTAALGQGSGRRIWTVEMGADMAALTVREEGKEKVTTPLFPAMPTVVRRETSRSSAAPASTGLLGPPAGGNAGGGGEEKGSAGRVSADFGLVMTVFAAVMMVMGLGLL